MLKTAKKITVLQVVNPGEIIGYLDEKAAKQLGLQQWNQTKGTVYRLDSKTLSTLNRAKMSIQPQGTQ